MHDGYKEMIVGRPVELVGVHQKTCSFRASETCRKVHKDGEQKDKKGNKLQERVASESAMNTCRVKES